MLKQTALHAAHKSLGGKMVPFGGWDMPVWYSSAREEHLAVRTVVGLFDVSHMGVLDVRGPHACAFLDHVATNDVSRLAVGRSQYAYLLDDAGAVIDDIMIYRVADERYLVVVNAANNDKDIEWLRAQNAGEFACDLRDLRDPTAGADMRVDLALQGPASQVLLEKLLPDAAAIAALSALPWAGIFETTLAGHTAFVSRTGYTGERIAYELFVHPDESVALWHALLDAGARPCGLAARDSLRTEAGLPLYGHELAGPLALAPFHIGFDNFVKQQKPADFIGKATYAAYAAAAKSRLVRFRMNEKGVRPSKLGDPVLDRRGRVVGTVTSCAQDTAGFLTRLALLESAAEPGTGFAVVALPERMPDLLKPFAPFGSRALVPDAMTVVGRWRKE
ncbi:MAG: glycine cleavage system aminomethyltransferase GcvT [Chloroflexi bacterium]|nr:glycine cleavage system aminomethyltransferase GcvT [Chloroflexota bacterium]